jgi:hypothetical protein
MTSSNELTRRLVDLQDQLAKARQELGRLHGIREGLGKTKNEILMLCQRYGVEPKLEAIQSELALTRQELDRLISQIDRQLRKT